MLIFEKNFILFFLLRKGKNLVWWVGVYFWYGKQIIV
jgi:hypothetical protein